MSPTTFEQVDAFKTLLRKLTKGYTFDVLGLYLADGSHRSLPKESSVVGKILELSVKEFLEKKLLQVAQLRVTNGGERSYPDLSFHGDALGGQRWAVDVKCARRNKKGTGTDSRIAIATYDADYFRYPMVKAGNIVAPYASYSGHLALIAIYDYFDATARNVELIVAEKWRIATKAKASGTRCYVAASATLDDLRGERGDFTSEEEFQDYWRAQPIGHKKSTPVPAVS